MYSLEENQSTASSVVFSAVRIVQLNEMMAYIANTQRIKLN